MGRDITADERKADVLRATLGCIAAVGHENVRLRDVAKSAGVSVGSLQHYFESRDDLIAQAFRQASEDTMAGWDRMLAARLQPWDRIVAMIEGLTVRDNLRDRCLMWIDFGAAAARNEAVAREFSAAYARWIEILTDAVEEGVTSGTFAPLLATDVLVEVLLEQIDGSIFNLASGIGLIDGPRMHDSSVAVAEVLLGHRSDTSVR